MKKYTNGQLTILVILRIIIGWHFLYEGVVKLLNPNWSSLGYLIDSEGIFSGIFQRMAANPTILDIIDLINIWGLMLIGVMLILGLFSRISAVAGMILLAFYYLSHPPLIGVEYAVPSEGNYFLINKNLIEFFTLWALILFPTSRIIGLDRLIFKEKSMSGYETYRT